VKRRDLAAATSVLAIFVGVAGCGDDVIKSTGQPPPPPRRGAAASASASASASAPPIVFGEADFTTSDRNRDPFRGYPEIFVLDNDTKRTAQTQVIAKRFALDELKLVAIVTGGTNPRAMFIDPEGKGHIVTLGQLIGRSELVKAGGAGGAEYDLNWRVDRIREGDVVFVRENPGRANVPTATRVVALRPEGDSDKPRRLPPGPSEHPVFFSSRLRGARRLCARERPAPSCSSHFLDPTTWPRAGRAAYDRERVRRDRA
jgi:type IV pilus assembly protein PilP